MRTLSIRFKLVAAVFPLLLLATALVLSWVHERSIRVASQEAVEQGARLYADLEAADVEKLSSTLEALSRVEALKRASSRWSGARSARWRSEGGRRASRRPSSHGRPSG